MQLTSVEAHAAKADDWTHGGEQVTVFRFADVPKGLKQVLAKQLGVTPCPRCPNLMVHSSYKTCMVCLIKKRAQKTDARAQKTDAHVRAEQTAAAGSVTAGAIATLLSLCRRARCHGGRWHDCSCVEHHRCDSSRTRGDA